jgi:urease accessory protein
VRRVGVAIGLATAFLPAPAEAHLVTTGLGPVYDGIGHLLMSPEDLIPALALALYAGLRGPRAGRFALFLLPAAWLVGGLVGLMAPARITFPVATVSFLALGALVAADLPLPAPAIGTLAAALGLAHGFVNGAALAGAGGARGLIGIVAALFVVAALASAFVVALERPWKRIAVRVAGSWIAAVGLLLLGWSLRGTR